MISLEEQGKKRGHQKRHQRQQQKQQQREQRRNNNARKNKLYIYARRRGRINMMMNPTLLVGFKARSLAHIFMYINMRALTRKS